MSKIEITDTETFATLVAALVREGVGFTAHREYGRWIIELEG